MFSFSTPSTLNPTFSYDLFAISLNIGQNCLPIKMTTKAYEFFQSISLITTSFKYVVCLSFIQNKKGLLDSLQQPYKCILSSTNIASTIVNT